MREPPTANRRFHGVTSFRGGWLPEAYGFANLLYFAEPSGMVPMAPVRIPLSLWPAKSAVALEEHGRQAPDFEQHALDPVVVLPPEAVGAHLGPA